MGVRRPHRGRCDRADQVLYRDREPGRRRRCCQRRLRCAACAWPPPRSAAAPCARPLTSFDRAARQPYGRVPEPTSAGNQLRHAARLLAAYAYLTGDRTLTPVVLLVRLAALAEAVAELRESQQRAAQAAAALPPPGTSAPPPGSPRPPGHQAGPRLPRRPHRNPPGPGRNCRRTGPAQLPRRAPPAAARTRAARTWRRRPPPLRGDRHLGHAAPPAEPGRPGNALHRP